MSEGRLGVYSGRIKAFRFTWREGLSSTSNPINLTGATVIVISTTLPENPTINILDRPTGLCEIVFTEQSTANLKSGAQHSVKIALTFTADPEYSPDPVAVGVTIL